MKYTYIDKTTGNIVGTIDASMEEIDLNTPTNAIAIEGDYNSNTCWYSNGKIIDYTDDQIAKKSKIPMIQSLWDNNAMEWVSTGGIDVMRTQKLYELQSMRQIDEDAPINTPFGVFDADAKSREKLLGASTLLPETAELVWTLADNTSIPVTIADLRVVSMLIMQRTSQIHVKHRVLKDSVAAATTLDELININW